MEHIVIIGAGAMGSLFAARLALAQKAVTLVDVDAARLAALGRDGVALDDHHGKRVAQVRACRADEVAGPVDLVILFTKAMHSRAAIASAAHLAKTGCAVLTLQNGLGNAEAIAEIFPEERVLLGVTDWPADLLPPNGVAAHGEGHVWLGAYRPAGAASAQAAVDLLNLAGMNAAHDPDVKAALWEKAAFNAALNALATILQCPVGGLDTPEGRRIAQQVAEEAAAAAAVQDVALDRTRLSAKIDFALTHHKLHKPSMLQDRLAGRATEIDAINGQIVFFAEQAGLTAPVTATLAALVKMGEPSRS